jgi:glycerate 2-kinase
VAYPDEYDREILVAGRRGAGRMTLDPHALARDCLRAGIGAAHPRRVVAGAVSVDDGTLTVAGSDYDLGAVDDVLVVGGGNAAGTVAVALEAALDDRIDDGLVVTDVPDDTDRIETVEGSHPVPDAAAVDGTRRIRQLLGDAGERTLVLAVVTGGGSALLPAPAGGLTLDDLRETTERLLASGATIGEVNAVRKHLSASKGGRLADVAAPARTVVLAFSDVVGDDLAVVASGPFAPDGTTFADARAVVDRYDLSVPAAVSERLDRGNAGELPETPAPDEAVFDSVDTHVLANGHTAARAAVDRAAEAGVGTLLLSTRVRGEAREAAKTHVAIGEEAADTGNPIDPPAVVVSGGETTVTRRGDAGTGGPNHEFALSAALELDTDGVVVGAVDTDGIDGNAPTAGAVVDADTVADRRAARHALEGHDAAGFLAATDATVDLGPTGTNVNDLRVVVIDG